METQEKTMNESESLQLITEMIDSTKRNLKEDSYRFLYFGYLFFIVCVTNLIMNMIGCGNYIGIAELIIIGLGLIIGVIMGFKYSKLTKDRPKVKTHINKILAQLWLSFGICFAVMMVVLDFYIYRNASAGNNMPLNTNTGVIIIMPLIMMLYGIGIYMSGVIIKFRPLMLGGISCWALAVLAIVIQPSGISVDNFQWACISLALLTGYIIPGHMLRRAKE